MSTEIRRARIKLLVDKAKCDEGLNQAQFARKHGLDPTHLSQMLKSKRGIGNSAPHAFITNSKYLGIPYFFISSHHSSP